jgi:hypothetical protein
MVADERGLELPVLREDLQESILSRHRLLAAKRIMKRNRALRQHVRDLEDHLASLESHVSELEEETAELRKENEEVLGHDDDRGSDVGHDCDAIMDFYAPATPSEEDPEEVEPHISVDE